MEMNILIGKGITETDKELFFNYTPEDKFQEFPVETKFPQLLKALGIFPSTSEARRNGWDKDIPCGWTDFEIGKLKKRISILKIL